MPRPSEGGFPVLTWLLPARIRPHGLAFARFAALAEDIAANMLLSRSERLRRLDALGTAMEGETDGMLSIEALAACRELRASLDRTGISARHGHTLLAALKAEVSGEIPDTWIGLIEHCGAASGPVGRFLLDLSGEDPAACSRGMDALAQVLRILRQLRDFENPSVPVHRLGIPAAYMADALVSLRQLRSPSARGQVRAVMDRVLDGVDSLLAEARRLPPRLRARWLRIHVLVLVCRADKLARRLRIGDPLAVRIELSRWDRALCTLGALARAMGSSPAGAD